MPKSQHNVPAPVKGRLCVCLNQGRTQGRYKGIYTPKLPKLDFAADAEYIANLVNVNM